MKDFNVLSQITFSAQFSFTIAGFEQRFGGGHGHIKLHSNVNKCDCHVNGGDEVIEEHKPKCCWKNKNLFS